MDPEDAIYFPPRTIIALSQVPKQWREWYSRTGNSGPWNIDERMWTEVVEPSRVGYDALVAQKEKITAGQRQLEIERVDAKRERVERALSGVLLAAGVRPGLLTGASALLMQDHKFEVERNYEDTGWVVMVDTPMGLHSLDHVVAQFLDSDDGRAFQPCARGAVAATDNRYSDMIAALKRRR